ncbi:TIR domain-containing protein [Corallococcus exercitus]|uniref:TIR domain-containing protein n=1 Tax=Corallococcus exercitus TaxID=2316736 RepID=A0A7Y4KP20_9BACT|nr:TIR domain-containing protein [Corallococcus exercitus]NOK37137.1 TIR domain-containing protein [Corallococcus exercitus]
MGRYQLARSQEHQSLGQLPLDAAATDALPTAFDYFLSHNSREKQAIEQIAERLLDDHSLRAWIDVWAIPAASDWNMEIQRALHSCKACLVFLGPHGWGPFHEAETKAALARRLAEPSYLVLPVLLPGATAEDIDRLDVMAGELHRVDMRATGLEDSEPYQRISSALGRGEPGAPFPLGRPRLSPYIIRRDARRWAAPGGRKRNDDLLYRGRELAEALELSRAYPGQLDAQALEFLQASEHAALIRRNTLIGLLALVILLLGGASVWAELNRREAQHQLANLFLEQGRQALTGGSETAALYLTRAIALGADSPVSRRMLSVATSELKGREALLVAHDNRLVSLDTDKSGTRLVTAGHDGRIQLWSFPEGRLLRTLAEEPVPIGVVQFDPEGRRILSATHDGRLILFDAATGRELFNIQAHTSVISGAAWSPDGSVIATASYDNAVGLWRSTDGKSLMSGTHEQSVDALRFAPDGRWFATGGGEGQVLLWKVSQPGLQRRLDTKAGMVCDIAFTRDGNTVAAGTGEGALIIWDIASGTERWRFKTRDGSSMVSVDISPDSKWVAASTSNGKTYLKRLGNQNDHVDEFESGDYASVVRFDAGSRRLLTADWGGHVRVRDLASGSTLLLTAGPLGAVYSAAFDVTGKWIVAGGTRGHAVIWDLEQRFQTGPWVLQSHALEVNQVVFTSDGKHLLSAGDDGRAVDWRMSALNPAVQLGPRRSVAIQSIHSSPLKDWVLTTSKQGLWLSQLSKPEAAPLALEGCALSRDGFFTPHAVFSPDGLHVASTCVDGKVVLWRVGTAQPTRRIPTQSPRLMDLVFDATGDTLATAGEEATVQRWSAQDGRLLGTYTGATQAFRGVRYSPSGKRLVACQLSGSCLSWLLEEPQKPTRFSGHGGYIEAMDMHPSQELLVTAGDDHSVRLWDLTRGTQVALLTGHGATVKSVRFFPAGDLLASAGADGAVQLWSVNERIHLATFSLGKAVLDFVEPSTDGHLLAVGSGPAAELWLIPLIPETRDPVELTAWLSLRLADTLTDSRLAPRLKPVATQPPPH